uniref:Uncharacterized protein n=1 Tax=Glossina austeni TaxID=7395 RepID=A0A1A9VWT6_GLOAU
MQANNSRATLSAQSSGTPSASTISSSGKVSAEQHRAVLKKAYTNPRSAKLLPTRQETVCYVLQTFPITRAEGIACRNVGQDKVVAVVRRNGCETSVERHVIGRGARSAWRARNGVLVVAAGLGSRTVEGIFYGGYQGGNHNPLDLRAMRLESTRTKEGDDSGSWVPRLPFILFEDDGLRDHEV